MINVQLDCFLPLTYRDECSSLAAGPDHQYICSLSVGQVMTWASHVIGCGFILGWNLISLLVEFLFLSRVYQLVPQLAIKPQQQAGRHFLERQQEAVSSQGNENSEAAFALFILLYVSVSFLFPRDVSHHNLNILSPNLPRNSEKSGGSSCALGHAVHMADLMGRGRRGCHVVTQVVQLVTQVMYKGSIQSDSSVSIISPDPSTPQPVQYTTCTTDFMVLGGRLLLSISCINIFPKESKLETTVLSSMGCSLVKMIL